ncbi:MAG: hypothetical protein HY717_16925 [Planctomycetes bacterium]|nr:hypothetical protein [Planctomycetota bacterium]
MSYLLTGEKASYKGVDPKKPFDFSLGNWGAFEIVGRFSSLDVDSQAFPVFASSATSAEKARAWGGGVNWYLNKSVKLALDYEWTKFHGGGSAGDREEENALLGRVQVSF